MDFFETVTRRGSYREAFLPDAVPQADLVKILDAGLRAPSGRNQQTTCYVVVTDPATRAAIAEIVPTTAVKTAPAIIVPFSEFHQFKDNGFSFEIEDYAASVENVLLAITALGYASVWIDGKTKIDNNAEKLQKLLNAPEGKHVRAIIPVGKPE